MRDNNGMRGNSMRRKVGRLTEEGWKLHSEGELGDAIDRFELACELVRESIGKQQHEADPDSLQQLGSMRYAQGEWLLENGEYQLALDALTEAEQSYARLGSRAPAQLVTDVVLRRARVLMAAGRRLSAMAETQQAMVRALEPVASDTRGLGPQVIDAARVLAHGGTVQLGIGGDPDLAVAAADWALRKYLAAFRRGNQLSLPEEHVSAVQAAARTAYVAHTAAGRGDVAAVPQQLIAATSGGVPVDLDSMVARVRRSQPTLAAVLASAGRPDLAETLTAQATDLTLLMPAMRCPVQLAPAVAGQLAELGDGLDGAARSLLYLEAHALFARASQDQVPAMRHQFDHFGPRWAVTVMKFGQGMTEVGQTAAAVDAADWLRGILQQLAPWTMTSDEARTTAADTETWRQSVYATSGNQDAG